MTEEPDARGGRGRDGSLRRLALLATLIAVGCAPAMPPEDATPRGRFGWAVERFQKGEYHTAIRGLRDFLFREPLHPAGDSARFLLGEAYLETGQELLAANEFSQLAASRPNSPLADDAQLGACRSYWALSPDLPRDQEFTEKTIEECTRLLEFFPRSPLTRDASRLLTEARNKIAAKKLRTATWYYKRGLLESAIIYLETVQQDYPSAPVMPAVLYTLWDSYRRVGFQAEADAVRDRLRRDFPDAPETARLGPAGDDGDG
ncbi:MAG: outer membrane protein assembly factor BamD [Gemmatimonadota bacterium]